MTVVPIDKSGSSLPNGKMNGHANSVKDGDEEEDNAMIDAEFAARHSIKDRRHPQESYDETVIDPESFYGHLRALYPSQILKTQLQQLKRQGTYYAFDLEWRPYYEFRRLKGGKMRYDGISAALFWESDLAKWIEATCYFLSSPASSSSNSTQELEDALQEVIDRIEKAQHPDGYLSIYFTVVDPAGRMKNFRDMHEMYNCGHLVEAALAHHRYTGSRQFLNVMLKNIDCWINHLGPNEGQLHGYPGHQELELATLRLFSLTRDPKHLKFAHYLLSERGKTREDQGGKRFFEYEAETLRQDPVLPRTMDKQSDNWYCQAHLPLHEQNDILGHSVRALYLLTGAADLGGSFLKDARRLWEDAVRHKMYVIGGFGSEAKVEGFSPYKYHLPQSTDEGGCYVETCASVACMMLSERLLSHELDGEVREVLETCFHNTVLGGASLDGKQFSYENKLATCANESAQRKDWFDVCCCPPNLARTMGILGGYVWAASVDEASQTINVNIYLFIAATRKVKLPNGQHATIKMKTGMPWRGEVDLEVDAPTGWRWNIHLPSPSYAADFQTCPEPVNSRLGFVELHLPSSTTASANFDLPVRVLSPHPATHLDLLYVSRGPMIYVAEAIDNPFESQFPHFQSLGLSSVTEFEEIPMSVQGLEIVGLRSKSPVLAMTQWQQTVMNQPIGSHTEPRSWTTTGQKLTMVPWFSRANRGGNGHIRTGLMRVDDHLVKASKPMTNGYH